MTNTIAIAEHLAYVAHHGQTDKAGRPYFDHLKRVVHILNTAWPKPTTDETIAAWLHDTLEDTSLNQQQMLVAGMPASAVSIVEELTRPSQSDYLAWIRHLAEHGSLAAVRVKLADNEDNSSPERVAAIPEGQAMLERRHHPARAMLEARITKEVGPITASLLPETATIGRDA